MSRKASAAFYSAPVAQQKAHCNKKQVFLIDPPKEKKNSPSLSLKLIPSLYLQLLNDIAPMYYNSLLRIIIMKTKQLLPSTYTHHLLLHLLLPIYN